MFLIGLGIGLLSGLIIGLFASGHCLASKDDSFNENGEYVCDYDSSQPDGMFDPEKTN